nr:ORF6N domain-containing protein [uncultured Alistipes sp.]
MELQPIQSKIYEIRGQRVMLDFDLAELYQVETKRLKEAVRRNIERFEGDDFMFELSESEYNALKDRLRSQIASLETDGRGKYPKYSPFAFTEEGVAMLSGVLRSPVAIRVNRAIMRAFVAMRNYITTATTVTAELAEIRAKLVLLERADADNAEAVSDLSEDMRRELDSIYQAIGALSVKLPQARKPSQPVGFRQAHPEAKE